MTSQIDASKPVYGVPTTQSVRDNFATAKVEITDLQGKTQGAPFLPLSGAHMTGPMYLYNDPTDAMMPATKGYVDAGGTGGGGGMPEAPADANTYGRNQGAWVPVLPLSGGSQMTGELRLAGNPTVALGAVPKQYADAIATTANGALPLAGGTMTGPLILAADPTNVLGAVTKQYHDAGMALKAPINNPTFTGIVNTAARVILTGPSGPSLTLFDSTASRPSFGIWNNASLLSFGLTNPTTGVPSGSPVATMDQTGNFSFAGRVNATSGRLIATSNNNPGVTLNNTTGGSTIWGMWNNGTTLAFGISDPNGVPQNQIVSVDSGGQWYGRSYWSNNATFAGPGFSLNTDAGGNCHIDNGASANLLSLAVRANTQDFWCNEFKVHADITQYGNGIRYNGGNSVGFGWSATGLTMYVDGTPNGNVMTNANSAFDIKANTFGFNYWRIGPGDIAAYVGFNTPSNIMHAYSMGGDYGAIQFTGCDRRIKDNIAPVDLDPLAVLRQIALHKFDRQLPEVDLPSVHHHVGFIAQEIEPLIPEAVLPHAEEGSPEDAIVCVDLVPLVAYLIGGMQQIADRLERMEAAR